MNTETELSAVDLKVAEMFNKYFNLLSKKDIYVGITRETRNCCLIEVVEILNLDVWDWPHNAKYGKLFWEDVKEKIIKL